MGNCIDTGGFDENDPETDFTPLGERRLIVVQRHPSTQEYLRAELIRKQVTPKEVGDYAADKEFGVEGGAQIRWGRYWVREPGSDAWIHPEDMSDFVPNPPSNKFNFYMSFVQTVGNPGLVYYQGEVVDIRNEFGGWAEATIERVEQNYYFVKYRISSPDQQVKSPVKTEWIHRYSTRLRKQLQLAKSDEELTGWPSLSEMDWVRVKHQAVNQYLPAQITLKTDKFVVVQYDDPSLLITQETVTKESLDRYQGSDVTPGSTKRTFDYKIEHYNDFARRWRFNRLYVYNSALKSVSLTVHQMDGDNGHSLFRALSHQLFGTPNNFLFLRTKCLDHITKHKEYFSLFVDINFEYYLAHKKKGAENEYFSLGDHLDVQAICELYDARVEIYSELSSRPLDTIRFYQQFNHLPLIRLSYRGADHYDSISKKFEVLNARVELFNRLQLQERLTKTQAGHIDTTVIKLKGCVHWDKADEAYTALEKLFRAVGLGGNLINKEKGQSTTTDKDAAAGSGKDAAPKVNDDLVFFQLDVERKWTSDSNPDIVICYPDGKADEAYKDFPCMTIEGLSSWVEKAVKALATLSPAPNVNHLRQIAVYSRVEWIQPAVQAPKEKKEPRDV